jgi:hypothetical protein
MISLFSDIVRSSFSGLVYSVRKVVGLPSLCLIEALPCFCMFAFFRLKAYEILYDILYERFPCFASSLVRDNGRENFLLMLSLFFFLTAFLSTLDCTDYFKYTELMSETIG